MFYPFFTQNNDYDCGLVCLQMLYKYYFKQKLNIDQIKVENFLFSNRGINLLTLKKIAATYGLCLTSYQIEKADFATFNIKNPIIIQVINEKMLYHFVIIYKRKKSLFLIADPASENLSWISFNILTKITTGILVQSQLLKTNIIFNNYHVKQKEKYFIFLLFKKAIFFYYVVFFIITNLLLGLLFFFNQLVYKQIISQLFFLENIQKIIFSLLIIFLINNLLSSVHTFLLNLLVQKNYFLFFKQLVKKIHQQWFALKPVTMKNYNISFYLQLYQDAENLVSFFNYSLLELVVNFIFFVIVTIYLITISIWIWLISIAVNLVNVMVQLILTYFHKSKIKAVMKQKLKFQNQIISTYNDFESFYFRNLLAKNKNEHVHQFMKTLNNDQQICKMQFCNNFFNNFTKNIFNFFLLWFFLTYLLQKRLSVSDLIFINGINVYLVNFFNNLIINISGIFELKQSWIRCQQFFALPRKTKQSKKAQNQTLVVTNIKFKNCSFKINSAIILNKINFIFTNHTILIGQNGCGKTILLSIITGKFNNYEGSIKIEDQELKNISDEYWEKNCVYLNSNAVTFDGTVGSYLFNNDFNNVKLELYQRLNLNEILVLIDLNLNSYCHEHLSQGQKQVLNLCQIFFSTWKVILLDEALSNVNNDIKLFLIKKLKAHFSDSIIIYATHDQKMQNLFSRCAYLYQGALFIHEENKK